MGKPVDIEVVASEDVEPGTVFALVDPIEIIPGGIEEVPCDDGFAFRIKWELRYRPTRVAVIRIDGGTPKGGTDRG